MLENIKKRIIHFYTYGNIIEDFVEARRKKTAKLRRIIRACFYIQCALAAGCIAAALLMSTIGTSGVSAIIAGSVAVCVVAFISLGGGTAEKTILYILDLAYAVICFIVGGLGGSSAFIVCGILMLLSAAAALGGFFAAWCRQYLLDFSPARITRSDYTRIHKPATKMTQSDYERYTSGASELGTAPPPAPAPPPPPPKSEMEMLAERLSDILGTIPDIRIAEPDEKPKQSTESDPENGQVEAAASPEPVKSEESAAPQAEMASDTVRNEAAVTAEKPEESSAHDTESKEEAAPAAESAQLPDVVNISDVSVDFSIDG